MGSDTRDSLGSAEQMEEQDGNLGEVFILGTALRVGVEQGPLESLPQPAATSSGWEEQAELRLEEALFPH